VLKQGIMGFPNAYQLCLSVSAGPLSLSIEQLKSENLPPQLFQEVE